MLVKWKSDIAAATDAFKLDVLPLRGILSRKSHFFWVSKEIPLSSAPTITTKGVFSWKFEIDNWLSADKPTTRKPLFFNSSNDLFKFTILLTGMCSNAPAATLATVPVKPADLLWGMIIPLQSNASADLIIAPTLCGSVIPSKARIIGFADLSLEISINFSDYIKYRYVDALYYKIHTKEDREIFNYQTVRLLIPDYLNTNAKTMQKM